MMRIRTVVAVGSMALLGVVGTGSTALASDGGHAPGQTIRATTGHPATPAKLARCVRAHGGTVARLKDGGYQISVSAEVARACKRYLPPGGIPKGDGKLVLRVSGARAATGGPAKAGDEFIKCLKDNGALPAPGTVSSDEQSGAVSAGVPAGATVTKGEDGSTSVIAGTSAKPVDVPDACAKLAPPPGPVLQENAG